MYMMFEVELQMIIDKWNEGHEDEPMDGDEVDKLIDHLRLKMNFMQGNITFQEYLDG